MILKENENNNSYDITSIDSVDKIKYSEVCRTLDWNKAKIVNLNL